MQIAMQNKSFFKDKKYGAETGLGQFKDDKYTKVWYLQESQIKKDYNFKIQNSANQVDVKN